MGVLLVVAAAALASARAEGPPAATKSKPFGLEQVIAFYGAYPELTSQTFARSGDWRYWSGRGAVASRGVTHQPFLSKSVEEATNYFLGLDFEGNPDPTVDIDELGWDYDGGIDQHSAAILRAIRDKMPNLRIAVWQMRGPVAPELAAVYRDTVELVMMETYIDLSNAWIIPFHLQTARLTGLLGRTVIALGLGQEANELGGWEWTRTAEELDQKIRLIRFVAPESPGLAFFGKFRTGDEAMRMTDEELDEICARFGQVPTDGTGLEPELLELGRTFTRRYDEPAIFCSSVYVLPFFHSGHDGGPWGTMHEPPVARVLMMNLGDTDATGLTVRMRSSEDPDEVWAEGPAAIPARSVAVALVPIPPGKEWHGWAGSEILEVEAPGCQVFYFRDSRHDAK